MTTEAADDPREEHRRLVRRARMLLQAERDGGIAELVGTPPPPDPPPGTGPDPTAGSAPAAPSARPSAQPSSQPSARPAPARAAPADAVPAAPAFTPRVRPLDLPADVLAPFGDLPREVAECRRCGLCETRTRPVFGEGSPTAHLVFCGEGPGFEEDRTGRPFVGRAGELLTAMIEKGLLRRREDVFILNAVKCRPPENRTPLPEEIAACRPFLERQLATIRPRVIVALGNPACRALLGNVGGITSIRGREFQGFGATIVPTFHPAFLLRNPDSKREAWEDLKVVKRLLGDPA